MTRYEIAALVAVGAAVVLAALALWWLRTARRLGRELQGERAQRVEAHRKLNQAISDNTADLDRAMKTAQNCREARDARRRALEEMSNAQRRYVEAWLLAERAIDKVPARTTQRRYRAELAALRPPDD